MKHRSTSLYTDPFLLEDKIRRLTKIEILKAFAQSWHPAIELEQISFHSLREAIRYWTELTPINDRWKEAIPNQLISGTTSKEQLIKERILREKAFSDEMESFWQQLKQCVKNQGENGKISYWDFVGAETFDETVDRAFLTSFLITYGYATLEIHPLEEEMFIVPYEKPENKNSKKQLISVPIAVSIQDWRKWKKGEL